MQFVKQGLVPYLLESFEQKANSEQIDTKLTLFSDVVIELFEKMRDIYCVLESVIIVSEQIIEKGLKIEAIKTHMFT